MAAAQNAIKALSHGVGTEKNRARITAALEKLKAIPHPSASLASTDTTTDASLPLPGQSTALVPGSSPLNTTSPMQLQANATLPLPHTPAQMQSEDAMAGRTSPILICDDQFVTPARVARLDADCGTATGTGETAALLTSLPSALATSSRPRLSQAEKDAAAEERRVKQLAKAAEKSEKQSAKEDLARCAICYCHSECVCSAN